MNLRYLFKSWRSLGILLLLAWGNWTCGGRSGNPDQLQSRVQGTDTGKRSESDTAKGIYASGTLALKELRLPDGTRVLMHAGTVLRLSAKFNREDRELWVEGDAMFEEQENKTGFANDAGVGRPLVIHTKFLQIEIQTPGAKFRIDAGKGQAGEAVDLLSGRLKVTKSYHSDTDNEPETIGTGEMVMINRDIDLMEKEKMDGSDMKGWDADK
jgi:transmembrane sensor